VFVSGKDGDGGIIGAGDPGAVERARVARVVERAGSASAVADAGCTGRMEPLGRRYGRTSASGESRSRLSSDGG